MSQAVAAEERRLNSWKEIAAYFGNDQRTVKRWENTRGLPVRRLPGARSGVFALLSEIEAWERGESVPARPIEHTETLDETSVPMDTAHSPAGPSSITEESCVTADLVETNAVMQEQAVPAATTKDERKPRAIALRVSLTLAAVLLIAVFAMWSVQSRKVVARSTYQPLPHAKELYLQGRYLWNKRKPEGLKAALGDFEEAARIDPSYAAAYAGIADCYALAPEFAPLPGSEVYPRMLTASEKALALDDSLPEGHRALAFARYYWQLDPAGSQKEFEKAVRLAPNDATTHLWFANTLATSAKYPEAIAEVERARELDPTSPSILTDKAWILYQAGRKDEAMRQWIRLEQTDPDYIMVHTWLAMYYLDSHKPQDYLRQLDEISRLSGKKADAERLRVAAATFRTGGEQAMDDALATFEEDRYRQSGMGAMTVAAAMTRAGHQGKAVEYLESAYRNRDLFVPGLETALAFAPLRGTPRFEQLVAVSAKPLP